VNESSIARRYAKALFDLAVEEERFEEVGQELVEACRALDADPELRQALESAAVTRDEKLQIARMTATALGLSPVVDHTIRLLAERGRFASLPLVERHYRSLADEKSGRVRAKVVSAVPLRDEAARRLADGLSKVSSRNVVLERSIDPGLLGGVVAEVGGCVYDASLRTQLETLKKQLKA